MGASTTPSVVSFERVEGGAEGEVRIEVGHAACEQAERNPNNTFASVKRLIGRARKEASGAVADASLLNLLVEGGDGSLHLECEALGRSLPPEEISCHIIRTLLEDVERELGGEKVTRAVITVPAYFTDQQRRATEAAGLLAGLERVKLLREPEAAALAYGLDKLDDELILVFDLGGGTFDVSVLEVGGGIIEVLWTGGDAFLGGDDFDKSLAHSLLKDFLSSSSVSSVSDEDLKRIQLNKELKRQLLKQARSAKIRLSSARSANVLLQHVLPGLDLNTTLTQKQFEQICSKLLDQLAVPVRQVVRRALPLFRSSFALSLPLGACMPSHITALAQGKANVWMLAALCTATYAVHKAAYVAVCRARCKVCSNRPLLVEQQQPAAAVCCKAVWCVFRQAVL